MCVIRRGFFGIIVRGERRNELTRAPADYATVRREGSALFRREGTKVIAGDEWRVCFEQHLQNTDDFAQATPDKLARVTDFRQISDGVSARRFPFRRRVYSFFLLKFLNHYDPFLFYRLQCFGNFSIQCRKLERNGQARKLSFSGLNSHLRVCNSFFTYVIAPLKRHFLSSRFPPFETLGRKLFGEVMPNPVAAHALNSAPYKTTGRAVCSRYVRPLHRELGRARKQSDGRWVVTSYRACQHLSGAEQGRVNTTWPRYWRCICENRSCQQFQDTKRCV